MRCWTVVERLVRGFALCGFRPARLFAFRYAPPPSLLRLPGATAGAGWDVYDAGADYARLGIPGGLWRVSAANRAFALCAGLPPQLVVPASFDDARVAALASVRVDGRLPVVVWRSPDTHAVIVRAAPLTQAAAQLALATAPPPEGEGGGGGGGGGEHSASSSASSPSSLAQAVEDDRYFAELVRLAGGRAAMPLTVVD